MAIGFVNNSEEKEKKDCWGNLDTSFETSHPNKQATIPPNKIPTHPSEETVFPAISLGVYTINTTRVLVITARINP